MESAEHDERVPSLFRQRAAQRAAALRARRAAYREPKPRKSDEQAEEEREARGKPTLRARRGNLPSYKVIRGALTHVDESERGYYVKEDTFGVVLLKPTQHPPAHGEIVTLTAMPSAGTDAGGTYALYNIQQVAKRMFLVNTPEFV
jgi:hypothetical protein